MTSPYLNRPLRSEAEARTQWRCTLTLIGADISAEGVAGEPYQAFLAAFAVLDNSRAYHAAREKYPDKGWGFSHFKGMIDEAVGYGIQHLGDWDRTLKLERIEI